MMNLSTTSQGIHGITILCNEKVSFTSEIDINLPKVLSISRKLLLMEPYFEVYLVYSHLCSKLSDKCCFDTHVSA